MRQKDTSLYVLIFIILVLGSILFSHTPSRIISWDIFGYYLYLPFTFIYHDLGLKDFTVVENIISKYNSTSTFYQAMPVANGEHWVLKYPVGMAILYLPWFFAGHLGALLSGSEADGFSVPYQLALLYGSFIYTVIGLIFLRKSLRILYRSKVVSILLLCIVFGTNYLIHSVYHGQGLMSHNYLFMLFALLLWFTICWHKTQKVGFAIGIGISIGLAALSRPTEIVVAAIPLFWGIADRESFIRKIKLVWKSRKQLLLLILIVGFFGSIQLIYYKLFAGKFLYNSYGGNAGEGLELFHPYISEVLFSYRKGWLLYTPIAVLIIPGFICLFNSCDKLFYSVLVYFLISFYIIASWSCWWYADSFSQRAMLPMYVFLAIPLGSLFQWIYKQKKGLQLIFGFILLIFIVLNLFQSWQFLKGIIHPSRMTKAAYQAVFLKLKPAENMNELLLLDRSLSPEAILDRHKKFKWKELVYLEMAEMKGALETDLSDKRLFPVSPENLYSPFIEVAYNEMGVDEYALLRISARLYHCQDKVPDVRLNATFMHRGYPYGFRFVGTDAAKAISNKGFELELLYVTPEVRRPEDLFRAIVEVRSSDTVYVDFIRLEIGYPE